MELIRQPTTPCNPGFTLNRSHASVFPTKLNAEANEFIPDLISQMKIVSSESPMDATSTPIPLNFDTIAKLNSSFLNSETGALTISNEW